MIVKRKIIFDQSIDGHHLEYINHLYTKAAYKDDTIFYFILHPDFEDKRCLLKWPEAKNIEIDYFTQDELLSFKKNSFLSSYFLSKALKCRVKKFNVNDVFLINLISFLPFIMFFINKKIKISGIIYLIYLYRWKKSKFILKVQDVIKYFILSRFQIFDRVFLLNDQVSPRYLNSKFKTNVFKYLPDPIFFKEKNDNSIDIRKELNIESNKKILLHFGALNDRKGTLEILKAINSGNVESLDQYSFIFAGKVGDDIKEEFYRLKNAADAQIIVFDEYCSYDFLSALCKISNCILIPYKVNEQSSGILNYAALFNIPVMAIREGLIGRIVKKYELGSLISSHFSDDIVEFLNRNNLCSIHDLKRNLYMKDNSVENFKNIILD